MFLDYLIGKVANARSDKLAEAEATVSRLVNPGQALTCLCNAVRTCKYVTINASL